VTTGVNTSIARDQATKSLDKQLVALQKANCLVQSVRQKSAQNLSNVAQQV